MNDDPGVIFWSEVLRQTLSSRAREHRREPDYSIELVAAIAETNQRILNEKPQTMVG